MNRDLAPDPSSSYRSSGAVETSRVDAIQIPALALPTGGGAIEGIAEKLTVDPATGTARLSLPLPFSSARDTGPGLTLDYDSGGGNGVFGPGWALSLPAITRKTEGGLPRYQDTDRFVFTDADELVPELASAPDGALRQTDDGSYLLREEVSDCGAFLVTHYRRRIENTFSRIERWTHRVSGEVRWRVTSKDNQTTLYGWSAAARIADPADDRRVFQWLPELSFDDRGNCTHYLYGVEGDTGLDPTRLHNRNRMLADGGVTYTNRYLERVLYGNRTPYYPTAPGDEVPPETDYVFQTVFDYGAPDPDAPDAWTRPPAARADAYSEYRAGFEIRTTRLCRRVVLLHCFAELPGGSAVVKALDLEYTDPESTDFAFLRSATEAGYIKHADGTYSARRLPPLELTYRTPQWNREVKSIALADLGHRSPGPGGPLPQFLDLYNEGLAGLLTELGDAWYYQRNLGQGRFAAAEPVARRPSFVGIGAHLQVADLDGDGGKQLVSLRQEPKGFFELNGRDGGPSFCSFDHLPNLSFGDARVRLVDLDGDGRLELLVAGEQGFTWYDSAGRKGFTAGGTAPRSFDEERDPQLVFADATQTIFLADMSGDGLTDIVRIRNGQICYWPNLGYGRFGARVTMDDAPVFDHPDGFDPERVRLADIDGSGTADLIYLGRNRITCWKNLSGNRFSPPALELDTGTGLHSQSQISVVDLLGDGVACIVWASDESVDAGAPLKYLDLMGGQKPHLLAGYRNHLGKEVLLEYTPSTRFYLADRAAGRPWMTTLHFPVHCVTRVEIRDRVAGHRFVSSYAYHHGHFDSTERELRGFGMVERIDSEDFEHFSRDQARNVVDATLHQAPVVTRQWFDTGAGPGPGEAPDPFAPEYWPAEAARRGAPVDAEAETGWASSGLAALRVVAAPGLDPALLGRLTEDDWREVRRACRGRTMRSEVFGRDPSANPAEPEHGLRSLIPYTVEVRSCVVELLQPRGPNRHTVVVVNDGETLVLDYQRAVDDPRISHQLNLEFDERGNVLESAAITYPRRRCDATLPAETRAAQAQTIVTCTRHRFTNDATGRHHHRLRVRSETETFELQGVARAGQIFRVHELRGVLSDPRTRYVGAHEVDAPRPAGVVQARLLEHVRHLFYDEALAGPAPLHQLDAQALPYATYRLAYTPALLSEVFGHRVDDALMTEGRYTHSEGDDGWWISSGSRRLLAAGETAAAARQRFYLPVGFEDPYGALTTVRYDRGSCLFIEAITDAAGNQTAVERFDYRTLAPARLCDANANRTEVLLDELGRVKAMAVFGKGDEADDLAGLAEPTTPNEAQRIADFFSATDPERLMALARELLGGATARFVYDLEGHRRAGQPAVLASILRTEHGRGDGEVPLDLRFEYSSGLGQVVMTKRLAAPGRARRVEVDPEGRHLVTEVDTATASPRQLRWLGSGRVVLNNRGNPVKQYEPYFSVSPRYEDLKELVETGVTPLMHYDALGRRIATELPDGTSTRLRYSAWSEIRYDANDTVLDSAWYRQRVSGGCTAALVADGKDPARERAAAVAAVVHAETPEVRGFDTRGQTVLSIEHNRDPATGADQLLPTRFIVDVDGRLRSVIDAEGNVTVRYEYDLLGNRVYQESPDSGRRWRLGTAVGSPLRAWDDRGHELQYAYDDPLHRLTHRRVLGGDGPAPLDHIFDRRFYGEGEAGAQQRNVRGQLTRHYDTAGLLATVEYDFQGRPSTVTRRLARDYRGVPSWTDANLTAGLDDRDFTFITTTDALGRATQVVTPQGSVVSSSYDELGLLRSAAVTHVGAPAPEVYIASIDYNERGQRERIVYGNGVVTQFRFDRQTFRLQRLETHRRNGERLQDWHYTFDPVGNVVDIEDRSAPVRFFDNHAVTAVAHYTYDALYRLVAATGREHDSAPRFDGADRWSDAAAMAAVRPGDPLAVRSYVQHYQYDAVGNLVRLSHAAGGASWTRDYTYAPDSNRLLHTQVGSTTYAYQHHPRHGYMTALPHLDELGWDFQDRLAWCARQRRVDGGTAETTYYQYDGQGRRIRKVTDRSAEPGRAPACKDERIYLDGYEVYRRHFGAAAGLERVSLSLMDDAHRFVMVETRNAVDDGTARRLVRYQLPNHVGSASLELDGSSSAAVISYEEFHPYGTTAYQARNTAIRTAAKRYRFTGMERDDESGLTCHGVRYYAPWLGRWMSCDPQLDDPRAARPPAPVGGDARTPKSEPAGRPVVHPPRGVGRVDRPDARAPPARAPRHHPAPIEEPPAPERAAPDDPRTANPYAYAAQSPVVYRDPTGEVGIIQAWWNGYNNASTAGKWGYGFLFILAYLVHVIVNLVVLIASVTLFNLGGLFGALDFTWGGLQSVLGLGAGIVLTLLGADVTPRWGLGAKVEMPAYMGNPGGMSLGPVVLAGHGFADYPHEFGHTWQSRLLGPFYLFVIGIPSLISAATNPGQHSQFYTEKWADAWAM